MAKVQIDTGISRLLFYAVLRDEDAKNMLNGNGFTPTITDPRTDSYEYENHSYLDKGVAFEVSKFNDSPWGLYVYVNPPMVLKYSGSYQPSEESYEALAKTVNKKLHKIRSPRKLEDMKLSSVTVTADFELSKERKVDQYLGVIQQAFVPRHYCAVQLPGEELLPGKFLPYRQCCMTTSFLAHGSFVSKTALHMELILLRRAIRRKVGKKTLNSHYKALLQLSRQAGKMLAGQLKRMKLQADSYVSYDKAVKAIDGVKNEDTRKQMKYLLKKTRDLGSLSPAIDKLKKHYGLSKRQANRIVKQFTKLGISPVTVEDAGKQGLPGLGVLLKNSDKK